MKTTKRDFANYKKYCVTYLKEFGLSEWTVHFRHELLKDCFAQTGSTDLYVARSTLNTEWSHVDDKEKWLKHTARHEMLHLISGRLYWFAWRRFSSETELTNAEELIVKHIEHILDERGIK